MDIRAISVVTVMIAHMIQECEATCLVCDHYFEDIGDSRHRIQWRDLSRPNAKTHAHCLSCDRYELYFRQGTWYRNPASWNLHHHVRDLQIPPPTAEERAWDGRVQEEAVLDRADDPHDDLPKRNRAPRGTLLVYSSIFDCLEDLSRRMTRLENHAMTQTYSPNIHAPPFDRSSLNYLDESESASDEE